MDNLNTELLEEIGLTKSEISVYLALLELSSSSTGKIVEKSKVASSKIYEILDKLIHKGLVSYVIKANIKHFEASSPKRLLDYMNEKKSDLEKKEKELQNIIPQLELKRELSNIENETHVFKGIKGAKTAFDDILQVCKKNDEIQILGFSDVSIEFQNFLINFHNKRAKAGIKLRCIFGNKIPNMINEFKKMPNTQVKVLSENKDRPVAFLLYSDKVLFSMPTENLWIQIKSKKLNESFKIQFEKEWSEDVFTYSGYDNVIKKFDETLESFNKGDEYYVLGASLQLGNKKINDWALNFHKRRFNKKVKAKLLTVYEAKDIVKNCVINSGDKNLDITEIKSLSPDFSAPFQINLMGKNKVWFTLWQEDYRLFEINSKEIYDNFKKYFDALWNKETYVVKGLDAIEDIFNDMLNYKQCDFIGARGYLMDKRPKFTKKWAKKAEKINFKLRNIVDKDVKGHLITKFSFAKTKYTLEKEFVDLSVFWIYGNKVIITNWTDEEPIAVIIENKKVYDLYKKQFELLWKK
jgi:HTH-type transcriptional regulator, sugar sensing transcriptional regulator